MDNQTVTASSPSPFRLVDFMPPARDVTRREHVGMQARDIRPEGAAHIHELADSFRARGIAVEFDAVDSPSRWATDFGPTNSAAARLLDKVGEMVFALGKRYSDVNPMAFPPDTLTPVNITIPAPVSDFRYASALHEFGHATHGLAGGYREAFEPNAARWAIANARYWTRAMSESTLLGLWTYVIGRPSPRSISPAEFADLAALVQAREARG